MIRETKPADAAGSATASPSRAPKTPRGVLQLRLAKQAAPRQRGLEAVLAGTEEQAGEDRALPQPKGNLAILSPERRAPRARAWDGRRREGAEARMASAVAASRAKSPVPRENRAEGSATSQSRWAARSSSA
jgi:hypothetical protein